MSFSVQLWEVSEQRPVCRCYHREGYQQVRCGAQQGRLRRQRMAETAAADEGRLRAVRVI
jgi:hypothetical protein